MTRKQELILFIQDSLGSNEYLKVRTEILQSPEESILNPNDVGNLTFNIEDNNELINNIETRYDDDLINTSPSGIQSKITSW